MNKPHNEVRLTLPERLEKKRKLEVLSARLEGHAKLEKHVRPTFDRETGLPDGGKEPALTNLGLCTRCGLLAQEIVETDAGRVCDSRRLQSFAWPTDVIQTKVDPLEGIF